jgi:DNA-binding NtrC family response regulator
MQALRDTIGRVATADVAVLICGETGTGKELVAEAIHEASSRSPEPFVVCDLSAVAPALIESELFGHRRGAFTSAERERQGAFALAHHGTLFLDEIGELDGTVQPRLLRAIERKQIKPVGAESYEEYDVRVVAATHRDLASEVERGAFRADLYHRLAVVTLRIPPLRERREDIPLLARHFLARAALSRGFAPPMLAREAVDALSGGEWPGNVRELHNVVERAVSLSPGVAVLEVDALAIEAGRRRERRRSGLDFHASNGLLPFKDAKDRVLDSWEGHYLTDLLGEVDGNVSEAARRAGIARGHLHRLLRKHGLTRWLFR